MACLRLPGIYPRLTSETRPALVLKNATLCFVGCVHVQYRLGTSWNFRSHFIHAQGEDLQEKARYHVLVDCDYHDSQPDLKDAVVRFYRVLGDGATLLVLYILD